MPASESQVVVRNGFLEVVSGAEHRRPRANTDCPVGSELRLFLTDSLAHIAKPAKAEERTCQIISEASTETAGSQGEASSPLTARSNASSDAVRRPSAVAAAEQRSPEVILVPTFYAGASLVPMYQGEPWAAPVYGMPLGPKESQMQAPARQQYTAQRHWGAAPIPSGAPTTMMLRNLPVEFDRAMLLKLFDAEGFAGLYDFVYLPSEFRKSGCFGYCFINFVAPAAAESFQQRFQGFNRWTLPSDRIAEVSVSDPLQGLEAHIERYRDSPLMHESVPDMYKPVLLANGVRIAFPPPTKRLKAPRMRPLKGTNAAF